MSHLLASCHAKIARAKETLDCLDAEIQSLLSQEPKPYEITQRLTNNGRQYQVVVVGAFDIPSRLSVIAGEIVHQLRSSLDHLVCALVASQGGSFTRNHQFPICSSIKRFADSRARGAIDGVSVTAEEIIRSVQPYTSDTPQDTILAVLQRFDNIDKHQLLLIVSAAASVGTNLTIGPLPGLPKSEQPKIVRFHDPGLVAMAEREVILFAIDFETPVQSFHIEAQLVPQIAFKEAGTAKLVEVLKVLKAMLEGTTQTVKRFAAEF